MKLHSDNKISNLINEDDINLADGTSLSAKLFETQQQINELKNNVKWLYKYGGVGGSGSGGGGSTKLTAQFLISYTNTGGTDVVENITENSVFVIKPDTPVNIKCTITSAVTLSVYGLILSSNKNAERKIQILPANSYSGSIAFNPKENDQYTIRLNGEKPITRNFSIYTSVYSQSSGVLYGDYTIHNNSNVSPIPNSADQSAYYYFFSLTNYQPTRFNFEFGSILLNNEERSVEIIESEDTTTGNVNYLLKISFTEIFDLYGVYKFQINYIFGNSSTTIEESYVYKEKEKPFVYCYGASTPVYFQNKPNNAITSENYLNTVSYLIYGSYEDAVDAQYPIDIQISKIKNGEELLININNNIRIDSPQKITIANNDLDWTEPVKITFGLRTKSNEYLTFVYYLYLVAPKPVSYILKTKNNKNAYAAALSDTDDAITPGLISSFPQKDFNTNTINIKTESVCTLGRYIIDNKIVPAVYNNNGSQNLLLNVNDFVTNEATNEALGNPDVIYTVGIKYGGLNYDSPIFTVEDTNENYISIYKNKIVDQSNNIITDRFCIPDDGEYHLVLLYVKYNYVSGANESKVAVTNITATSSAAVFIDGIMETTPFSLNRCLNEKDTKWKFHPGSWNFNYLGVMCFYTHPSRLPENLTEGHKEGNNHALFKYIHDFDPIIPTIYYNAYSVKFLNKEWATVDASFYECLSTGGNWINYFNTYKREDWTPYDIVNKFITVSSPEIIINLCKNIPAYCIIPSDLHSKDYTLNTFVENTYTSYEEANAPEGLTCNFQKWSGNKFEDLLSDVQFQVKYQGSSTLLYSAKNFEISAKPTTDESFTSRNVYFTPNKNLFPKLELSFNLKADIVDSSHSNNVIIGNFVHEFTKDRGPFGKDSNNEPYRVCLTGEPVLLFIRNNIIEGKNTSSKSEYIFLGIYSLNLNRSSVNNLGYSKIIKLATKEEITPIQHSIFPEVLYYIETGADTIAKENSFRVAEVQGNSSLFDFSQYANPTLLSSEMFDDFFNLIGDGINESYNDAFSGAIKVLAKYIKDYIIDKNIFGTYNYIDTLLNSKYKPQIPLKLYYYKEKELHEILIDNDIIKIDGEIDTDCCVVRQDAFEALKTLPYRTKSTFIKGENTYTTSAISDPTIQSFILTNDLGIKLLVGNPETPNEQGSQYLYLFKRTALEPLNKNEEGDINEIDTFSIRSLCDYYVICMAFAMADSVLKNLTFKCPHYTSEGPNKWYLGFYDMDTAFGVSNSGGNVSFLAFSDFATSEGIILDYMEHTGEGWYDIPSTYLFLFAKYLGILNTDLGVDEKSDLIKSFGESNALVSPYYVWSELRKKGGLLENVDVFYDRFVNTLYSDIHPLIWNLNFLYKYFSRTDNTSTDTESKRFHGTRKATRKEWLDKRLKYLDVMFGYKANRLIGTHPTATIAGAEVNTTNPDITIYKSMFPNWQKGSLGTITVTVTDVPRTPLVLQSNTNVYNVQLTDDKGEANFSTNISSDVAVGFLGTTTLKTVDECGLFLVSSENNTITNDVIQTITINKNNINKTTLDLSKLKSVNKIRFESASTTINGNLTIENSDREFNPILEEVYLSKISSLNNTLSLSFNNLVVIKKLIIENCYCDTLLLKNIEIENLTISNNRFKKYNLLNINLGNNSLYIKDINTNSTNLNNINCSDITLECSNLTTLTLESITTNKCSIISNSKLFSESGDADINFKNLTVNYLSLKNSSTAPTSNNYADNIASQKTCSLTLNFLKNVNLSLIGIPIKSLTINGTKINGTYTTVTYKDNGLSGCSKLENITYNNISNVYVNTPYCFFYCKALNSSSKLLPVPISSTATIGMFEQTTLATEDEKFFPTKWFTAHKDDNIKGNDLSGMFSYCSSEKFGLTTTSMNNYLSGDTEEVELIFNNIKEFNTSLKNYLGNTKVKTNAMFAQSFFNIVTKDFTDIISDKSYIFVFGNSTGYLFIESKSLDSFELIVFSGYRYKSSWSNKILLAFKQQEDGIYFYKNDENKLSNYFSSSCELVHVELFDPYNAINSPFEFDISFPSSLKQIRMFTGSVNGYFRNLEKGFENVLKCVVLESFKKNDITYTDNIVDFSKLLFNEAKNDFRIIFGFGYELTDTSINVRFPKIISLEDLNLFFDLLQLQKDKTNFYALYSNNINKSNFSTHLNNLKKGVYELYSPLVKNFIGLDSIFSFCEVTNCEGKEVILNLNNLWSIKGLFAYCSFSNNKGEEVPLNIIESFKNDTINEMLSLAYSFAGTYLKPLNETLNIKCHKGLGETQYYFYMVGSFYDCKFNYTDYDTKEDFWHGPTQQNDLLFLKLRRHPILPDDFFNIQNAKMLLLLNCFSNSKFNMEALSGQINSTSFIPSRISAQGTESLFTNCNISYTKHDTEDWFYIFPEWYFTKIKCFNTYIPLGTVLDLDTNMPKYMTYLFESDPGSLSYSNKGVTLPNIPPSNGSGDLYYFKRCLLYKGYIKLSPDREYLLQNASEGPLIGLVPISLAYVLQCYINPSLPSIGINAARAQDKYLITGYLEHNDARATLFKGLSINNYTNII